MGDGDAMSATEANEERLALLEKKFSIDMSLTPQEVARLKELTTITDKAWPRYTESDHEILAWAKKLAGDLMACAERHDHTERMT